MRNEQSGEISFYIVAHADDWQLFMQPNVYNDLLVPGCKVIFIITTAGDAGSNAEYWLAREEGCKSSLRFCLAPLGYVLQSEGFRKFNNHNIRYWSVNNATCFFLRLPDGNLDGNGFPDQNNQSLSNFKSGRINIITALDDSSKYENWPDFYNTLQAIISSESSGISSVWINYLNPDIGANPNDHPDHIATGNAIQNMDIISTFRQALFVGYSVKYQSEYLPEKELFWKTGIFAAYEKAVLDACGYSTLREDIHSYREWCMSSAKFITIL